MNSILQNAIGGNLPGAELSERLQAFLQSVLAHLPEERFHDVAQLALLNEAQQATKDRDAALDALNDWLVEFCGVARIALADQPQQLEALQIAVVP